MEMTPKRKYAIELLGRYQEYKTAKELVDAHEKELQEKGFNTRNVENKLITNSLNATINSLYDKEDIKNSYILKDTSGKLTRYKLSQKGQDFLKENN